MLKSDFYYDLPEELIAQTPVEPRDSSRLMKVDKNTGEITHDHFYNICDHLKKGDLLIMNDSRVFPARLYGTKRVSADAPQGATGAAVEFLLLKRRSLNEWETMVRPGKKLKAGAVVDFPEGLSAEVLETVEEGNRIVRFDFEGDFFDILDRIGQMPLPPYITEKLDDATRYQTVYAREEGSAAAPTAGLHFTEELLSEIREMGIEIAPVMLHVGLGTFRPVKEDNIRDHIMHSEFFTVTEESAEKINRAKQNGGRVIAVGTTSCRVLESASTDDGIVHPMAADTGIFIYPGYTFKAVDALITNFHLPESTLVMLVSAFASKEIVLNAYEEAIKEKYHFFSFGDACFFH